MTTTHTNPRLNLRTLAAALALAAPLFAACLARADELSDLRARFQSRDPQLQSYKASGVIGETAQGYVDLTPAATAGDDTRAFIAAENTDRARLYTLIAQKEAVSPEQVAARNAQRNFSRATPGQWLKFPDGWKQKS